MNPALSMAVSGEPAPRNSIFEVVRDTAVRSPERLAIIVDDGESRTYGQLLQTARRLIASLGDLALNRGDRVCLWLSNRPEWIEIYVACLGAGLVVVPANPAWKPGEIEFLLQHSGARAIFCADESVARARELRDRIPTLGSVIDVDGTASEAVDYRHLIDDHVSTGADDVEVAPQEPAMVIYTSGTSSGRPKGVVTSHRLLLQDIGLAYTDVMQTTSVDRCLFVTPLFHNNALGACLGALAVGASVLFPRRFSASRFWPMVDRYRPTYLFTMAPIVQILLASPPSSIEREHGMRAMFVLAAGNEATRMEERFGAPVIDCYGMSECPCGTYTRIGEPRRPGSAGRAFPHVDLRIMREDGGFADPGEVGEVVFRHGRIFDGYLDDPVETARVVRDGWFHTGDLGWLDADGFFYFVDRGKDVIRRAGENVSSQEVETVLRTHPDILDVAAVAVPDPVIGERVAVVIVPAGKRTPELQELRSFGAERLADYKLPDVMVLRDELPRTANGKVQKFRLREELRQGMPADRSAVKQA